MDWDEGVGVILEVVLVNLFTNLLFSPFSLLFLGFLLVLECRESERVADE